MRPDPKKTWGNLFYPPADYDYFAQAGPFPGGSTLRKASWAADAALLAYAKRGAAWMAEDEFDRIVTGAGFERPVRTGNWHGEGTEGFFARSDSFAMVAFRGTERKDPKDFLTDLDAIPVEERDYVTGVADGSCLVHQGFRDALDGPWPQVADLITRYRAERPEAEICFCGHSLGASLAMLAVSRFGGGKASLYTIGCPRTGNAAFCARACARADRGVYRFVNGNDPVTHVPPEDRWFQHPAAEGFYIDAQGGITERPAAPLSDFTDLWDALRALPHAGPFTDLDADAPEYLADHSPGQYGTRIGNAAG